MEFKYKTFKRIEGSQLSDIELNDLGVENWELISVYTTTMTAGSFVLQEINYIFKRTVSIGF